MRFFTKTRLVRGFTLVELLVVISIIAVLSALVYANFSKARASARDNIRQADLKDLQLALELYKAQNGKYPDRCPSANASWSGNIGMTNFDCDDGTNNYIKDLVPQYMPALPIEAKTSSDRGYIYSVRNGNKDYKIMAHYTVETKKINLYTDDFARCLAPHASGACPGTVGDPDAVPIQTIYAVYSPGAETW